MTTEKYRVGIEAEKLLLSGKREPMGHTQLFWVVAESAGDAYLQAIGLFASNNRSSRWPDFPVRAGEATIGRLRA